MTERDRRLIRVFLSSTFVDFQEERSLLVKQVFPSLRRRAQSRGVEIVDVDLRWGVTEEQTQRGETLPLCLAEIDRCRPYFIGLLGERYGLVPPVDFYGPELLERQPWLKEQMGKASVTELEILHGVLGNPEMAGHAFFYFRDPAYAEAQKNPWWMAESRQERERLAALKENIRRSGFPVVEDLPDPREIAERIEADLWELIDSKFPEREPPDALEREEIRHADYRRARTGLYLDGQGAVAQLEEWIQQGEQQILITGESGAGKSALIANWMEARRRSQPQDVVYAHHLGCTNDASALRPMLARLIDTASRQLLQAELIAEALPVPVDWWELVAEVAKTLQMLGAWCQREARRWIWVLDGLDRLRPEDQKALPWLPQTLPAGVSVVASALGCSARTLLSERDYTTLTIEPLGPQEQEQLIQRFLQRYTKQLDAALRQQILAHPLSGSPLFLKVLLEELRQCGHYDTLAEQLYFYLSTASVDELYQRVLERLENDGHGEAVRRVMTALWASRAGLSEAELLAITGLAPLEWAAIDLALEKAFGRNGNRLVFDHDYLRTAVENRYLPTDQLKQQAHGDLAEWFEVRDGWDERDSEELPWQLREARRLQDLREWLLLPSALANLQWHRGSREILSYWLAVNHEGEGELDELLAEALEEEIEKRQDNSDETIWFIDQIARLLHEAGLCRKVLLRLRKLSLQLAEAAEDIDESSLLTSVGWLAMAHQDIGDINEAESLYRRCLEGRERLLGLNHSSTLTAVGNLACLCHAKGDFAQAEELWTRCLEATERLLGPNCPSALINVNNLAVLYQQKGDYEQAEVFYMRCLETSERLLGSEHRCTLTAVGNLAGNYQAKGDFEKAEALHMRCLDGSEWLFGLQHPDTLITMGNIASLFQDKGDFEKAETFNVRCLEGLEQLLGTEHPSTLTALGNLAFLYQENSDFEKAEALHIRCLASREKVLGIEHPDTLTTAINLAALLTKQGRHAEAVSLRRRELAWCSQQYGDSDPGTLMSMNWLAIDLREMGALDEAERLFRKVLDRQQQFLTPGESKPGEAMVELAKTLEKLGRLGEAMLYFQQSIAHNMEHEGTDGRRTTLGRFDLARILYKLGRTTEAMRLLDALQESLLNSPESAVDDRSLLAEAALLYSSMLKGLDPECPAGDQ